MPIKAGTLGGHQIHAFHSHNRRGMEQFLDHPAAEAVALEISGYNDVSKHGPAKAIGGSPAEAHQALAAPEAHHGVAAWASALKSDARPRT